MITFRRSAAAAAALALAAVAPAAGHAGAAPRVPVAAGPVTGAPACPGQKRPTTPAGRGVSTPVASAYLPGYGHPEVDVRTTDLDLGWDGARLSGTAVVTFVPTRAIGAVTLDLSKALAVSSVRLDGTPAPVSRGPHTVTVVRKGLTAGSTHTLSITYSGTPRAITVPMARPSEKQGWLNRPDGSVSTYAEPYGASTWAPVNELPSDKAVYSLRMRTRAPMSAVFNGSRCAQTTTAGWTTSSWGAPEPMSAYLLTLSIGRYGAKTVTMKDGRAVWVHLRPRDEKYRAQLHKDIAWSYDFLVRRLGPYPFATLGYVMTDGDSAMETQTMVSLANSPYSRSRAVVLHEMAHQWFGDAVTLATWRDLWLNEGLTMFMELQDPASSWARDEVLDLCRFAAETDGQAGHVRQNMIAGDGPYMCGALAVSELRQAAGPKTFWKAMAGWPASRTYGTASRADFVRYWKSATGRDAAPVLAKWLDRVTERTTTTAPLR